MVRSVFICFLHPSIFIWTCSLTQFEFSSHFHEPERWVCHIHLCIESFGTAALSRIFHFTIQLIWMRCKLLRQFTVNHWNFEWRIKRFKCLIIECMHTTLMTLNRYKPNANFVAAKWKKKKEKKFEPFGDGSFDNEWQTLHDSNVSTFCDWRSFCSVRMFWASRRDFAPKIASTRSKGVCENMKGKWKELSKVIDLSCMQYCARIIIPSTNVATYSRMEWTRRAIAQKCRK